jgi:GNAT superfamily N-acetyltransferase
MGRHRETRDALARAESTLSRLDGEMLTPSAFGYHEASFRFHEGNAYMHMGEVRHALQAQDRALELCRQADYSDWALTRLDRAQCLTICGDSPPAHSLLAWDNGELVGFASYSFLWPAVGLTRSLYLKELYVAEAARRKGVGKLLMRRLYLIAVRMTVAAWNGQRTARTATRSGSMPSLAFG